MQPEVPSHTDDWLMTYADVITLLMCLFAVFLSISIPKQAAPPQPQIETPLAAPPRMQDVLEGNLPLHGLEHVALPTADTPPAMPAKPDQSRSPTKRDAAPVAVASAVPAGIDTPPAASQAAADPEKPAMPPAAAPANAAPGGDRITTLEMNSAAFFDSGSASLSKGGEAILGNVTAQLKSDAYNGYQITVEGHTDDSPISTAQFPSNWELSTARASAVVHFLLDQGIPAQKLRAAGYADTFPKVPNRDARGTAIPDNQAQNRRVVITLEKIEKAAPGSKQ